MIPGPDFKSLALATIGAPLIAALILLFFGQRLERVSFFGRRIDGWTGWIATLAMARSFVGGGTMFFELLGLNEQNRSVSVHLFDWIFAGSFRIGADVLIDQLAVVMVLVVTGVGMLIHLYSIAYMQGDPRYPRYFAYLNLFAASMLLLVLADNLLL